MTTPIHTKTPNMDAPSQIQAHGEQFVNSALPLNEGPPEASQTASDFIDSQLKLEADAREALPYAFDHCTNPLGPIRQNVFSCLTCNPPPTSPSEPYNPAGVCYSCSIACHGEHTLVELFARRNFTCDCGTTRLPSSSPCTLRIDPTTGIKGPIHSQTPAMENTYNRNFQNRFCGCGEIYNAFEEKGTMFQCLGLATEQDGGCGEDWWHPECVLGLGRDWLKKEDVDADGYGESLTPLPPGFPQEEEFEVFVCYKCVEANPWIKGYAGTEGFLRPVFKKDSALGADLPEKDHITSAQASGDLDEASSHVKPPTVNGESTILENASKSEPTMQSPSTVEKVPNPESSSQSPTNTENKLYSEPSAQIPTNAPYISKKRKADDDPILDPVIPYPDAKKLKPDPTPPYHESLPPAPDGISSIFLQENFRDKFCRCSSCYPLLRIHPQLLEEEDSYEPPLSQDGQEGGGESVGTGSLLDMGEAALSNVDRVRAIEGVMAYNHLKDKVKSFLQPFAESGTPVGAEDIKAYFEKLRGDDQAIKAAGGGAAVVAGRSTDDGGGGGSGDGSGSGSGADGRREQSGY